MRMSRELERDAIEAGLVQPWRRTNARRSSERKERRLQRLSVKKSPKLAGQILLFPELARPVARLHSFGGGFIPPAVSAELEFRRRRLGMSQKEVAEQIGCSQGHLANALRGHDPISSRRINRLRSILIIEEKTLRRERAFLRLNAENRMRADASEDTLFGLCSRPLGLLLRGYKKVDQTVDRNEG